MLNLNKGEHKELVFVNEPALDLQVVQEENSSLRIVVINFDMPVHETVNKIQIEQAGTGCRTDIYALAYAKGAQQVQTHTKVIHTVGGGESHQLVKFILADNARGDFYGEMLIPTNAKQVNATQTNRNLLLSPEAVMRTRPQLLIYADDVQASHGATTGQLDESALFYMQQRGISRATAQQMLVQAFMQDILDLAPDVRFGFT